MGIFWGDKMDLINKNLFDYLKQFTCEPNPNSFRSEEALLLREHGRCVLGLVWKVSPTISELELLLHKDVDRLTAIAINPVTNPELLVKIYEIAKADKHQWIRQRILSNPNCPKEFIENIFNTTKNAFEIKAILENPLVNGYTSNENKET